MGNGTEVGWIARAGAPVVGALTVALAQLVGWAAPVSAPTAVGGSSAQGLSGEQLRRDVAGSRQGTWNDCYFLAALGAITRADPEFLARIIAVDSDGWTVRIHDNLGRLHPLRVHISHAEVAGAVGGARDEHGEPTLVTVLECAYRRTLHGTLFTRTGGLPSAGLAALLGHPVRWTMRPRRGWTMIHEGLTSGGPVGYAVSTRLDPPLGPDPSTSPYTIRVVPRHAYWVRGIDEQGRVILVNTWGRAGHRRAVSMPAEVHLDRRQFARVVVQTAEFRPTAPVDTPR